jgi:[acyl-carrier-protein] S-malonyltransferase
MFAVLKLDDIVVESICRSLGQAYPANYNCPGQLVVACADYCAEKLQQEVSGSGGKALKLAVSGAFHSPFMDDAAKAMAAFLESRSFGQPGMPLYANATAQVYGDPKELLAGQVNSPVLWRVTIENMIADGFDTFIEAGPGKTLSGLVRKICSDATVCNVSDLASLAHTLEMLEKR